ncbi:MAK10-like protein [Tanacetum coccineum]
MLLCLFQFSLRDQASNWLERLLAGSISTWEDLTTRFLAQLFLPGRTTKLRSDILMSNNIKESLFLKHGLVSRTYSEKSLIMASTFGSKPKSFMTMSIPPQDEPLTNRPVWSPRHSLLHGKSQASFCRLCILAYRSSESYQMKLEKALIDFDSHQERRLSSLRAQLGQQQDDMISKINLLWKAVSEKLDDMPTRNTAGNPTAQINFASTDYPTKEELRGKGIKSPSKLLSLKYLSQSSLAEQNRNPSSPKCVHFVNSIIILNKEDEAKESTKPSATEYKDHELTVESEEEFEEETEEETEEEEEDNPEHFDVFPTMKELGYHEWLLKNP